MSNVTYTHIHLFLEHISDIIIGKKFAFYLTFGITLSIQNVNTKKWFVLYTLSTTIETRDYHLLCIHY